MWLACLIVTVNHEADESLEEREEVLTTVEVMKILKISRPTLLKYIHRGDIKAVNVGKGWRILGSELDRFLRGHDNQ